MESPEKQLNMTAEQLEQLKIVITATIKNTVNGKIDTLTDLVNKHIEEDKLWKEKAEPAVNLGNNTRTFGRIVMGIFGVITVVTGTILGVLEVFKNIKK